MSVTSPFLPRSVIITRLRAAGCVFAEDEAELLIEAAETPEQLAAMVDQRVAGFPLEPILGWVEFAGLRIAIDPGVFVPRRRTQFLVSEAVRLAHQGAVVLDLCCGSGALGVALAASVDGIELYAADVEAAAVRCARRNLESLGGLVFEGDLYAPLPGALRGRVDILVANAPYVPTDAIGTMPPEARIHEPRVTLDGGEDGLDLQRRVADEAPRWLAPDGHLLVETSERQAPQSLDLFTRAGLIARVVRSEELDATVVVGTLPHIG
jgi:release factor glutamine methyltransferase